MPLIELANIRTKLNSGRSVCIHTHCCRLYWIDSFTIKTTSILHYTSWDGTQSFNPRGDNLFNQRRFFTPI